MYPFKFYNNNKIISLHKCGTRFLDIVFDIKDSNNRLTFDRLLRDVDFEWFIVRDPYEHFVSALCSVYNSYNYDLPLDQILMKFIYQKEDHWVCNMYKNMYGLRLNREFKLVELKNLSEFLDYLKISHSIHDKKLYNNLDKGVNRIELIEKIKIEFPEHYKLLMEIIKDETKYYNLLLNKCEIYEKNRYYKSFI